MSVHWLARNTALEAVVAAQAADDLDQTRCREQAYIGQDVDAAGPQVVAAHSGNVNTRQLTLELLHEKAAVEVAGSLAGDNQDPTATHLNHGGQGRQG